MSDGETKTYLLNCSSGRLRRVTVPKTWKLTFGPTVPGLDRGHGQRWSLRFYENSKDNLRAVFTDVEAFREEGIQIQERVTHTKRRRTQRGSHAGNKDVIVEARITEWIDPDDDVDGDSEEFLQLTDDTE